MLDGAGMKSLAVDAVVVDVIMGPGMHSLVPPCAVTSSVLAVVSIFLWIFLLWMRSQHQKGCGQVGGGGNCSMTG